MIEGGDPVKTMDGRPIIRSRLPDSVLDVLWRAA
jgi:hypothetical protein